jgi:hypothetical protein
MTSLIWSGKEKKARQKSKERYRFLGRLASFAVEALVGKGQRAKVHCPEPPTSWDTFWSYMAADFSLSLASRQIWVDYLNSHLG